VLIEKVGGDEGNAVDQVGNALIGRGRAAPDDARNGIPLCEKQFGQVGAVLAGDSGDECVRQRETPPGAV
jgi:hypothetical protein